MNPTKDTYIRNKSYVHIHTKEEVVKRKTLQEENNSRINELVTRVNDSFANNDNSEKKRDKIDTVLDRFKKHATQLNIPPNHKNATKMQQLVNQIQSELAVLTEEIEKKIVKIPNIIFFVYGMKKQTESFELYKYIAIESANQVNHPDRILFYYHYEPFGKWWQKAKEIITPIKIPLPTEINGIQLNHYAHMADLVRITKMVEHGGIYLDIDTICVRPFADLLCNDFVMGLQGDNYGLCNATMMGKPNSHFAKKWLDTYQNFRSKGRDEYWDEHSVIIPYYLSKKYSEDITILESNQFFYPLWNDIKECLFSEEPNQEAYSNIVKNSYSIHLWETFSQEELKSVTEENIHKENTLYNILARKFLKNRISIVMLTYNRLEKTRECLESYLPSLDDGLIEEFIILDNASDKETVEYLQEFSQSHKKIRIIYSEENLGVGPGRAVLFKEAKGDIIASIDSDATLVNKAFFEKVANILYNEEIGMVGVCGAFIYSWKFGTHQDTSKDDEQEFQVDVLAGCCQCFRRDMQHFGFQVDPEFGKFWCEDTDLCYQLASMGKKMYRIKQKGYLLHEWGGSGNTEEFKGLFEKNWNYLKKKWLTVIEIQLDKQHYIQPQPCNDIVKRPRSLPQNYEINHIKRFTLLEGMQTKKPQQIEHPIPFKNKFA